MPKRTKKFLKLIAQVEAAVGHPILVRDTGGGSTPPPSPAFVAVFGTASANAAAEVLGSGVLATNKILLADPDTVARLNDGATPTMVGFAWVDGSSNRTQARTVRNFGHRELDNASDVEMWAMELSSATTAPLPPSGLPEGSSPASGWCFLFPWLSMCQTN